MSLNDKNSNKKKSSEILVLFVALLVSCATMYYFVKPLYREVKIAKLEISVKEKNIESKKLLLLRVGNFSNGEEDINENLGKIDSLIPNRNNYEDYLAHIVKLASAKNIIANDFSVSDEQSSSPRNKIKSNSLSSVAIDFSAAGGFLNFVSFLRDIENGIPFIQVEAVSISGGEETATSDLLLNYQINLKFFYY
jgi:Tfp pilus assembly protein PilO